MEKEIFTIEDSFNIFGRGVAIVGKYQLNLAKFNVGTAVVLIYSNGTKVMTEISGLEKVNTVSGVEKIAFLIKNVAKEDIPIGTKVLIDTSK